MGAKNGFLAQFWCKKAKFYLTISEKRYILYEVQEEVATSHRARNA